MDKDEFKAVMDAVFELMSTDDSMGPKLRKARVPQRFIFPDQKLVLNVTTSDDDRAAAGQHLYWVWGDKKRDWEPDVEMMMDAPVSLRYFQGKVNVPIAIAKGDIKTKGKIAKSLKLIPITRPVYKMFRQWLGDNGYDHLIA